MKNSITIDMIDDWAGAAMQALVSCRGRDKDLSISELAAFAYAIASEMASARGEFIEAHGDDLVAVDEGLDDDPE